MPQIGSICSVKYLLLLSYYQRCVEVGVWEEVKAT